MGRRSGRAIPARSAELRGQYAHVGISDAGRLNEAIHAKIGVSPNVASELRGFYGEGAYHVIQGPARDVAVFARYENFDTQYRMPAGFLPLEEFDRTAWVVGATYYPDPDVAIKFDYTWLTTEADSSGCLEA